MKFIGPVAAVLAAFASTAHAQSTVFFDDFSDGNRDGWFSSYDSGAGAPAPTVTDGQFVQGTASGSKTLTTHFAPVTLSAGEYIQLDFDVTFTGLSTNSNAAGFRAGLFGSEGNALTTADGPLAIYGGYRGYFTSMNPGSSATTNSNTVNFTAAPPNSPRFWVKQNANDATLLSGAVAGGSGVYGHDLGSGSVGGTNGQFVNDTQYHGTLLLTYTGTGYSMQVTYTGGALSGDTSGVILDASILPGYFDTLAFATFTNASASFAFDNVAVTTTGTFAAVPEPSTCAAIAGLAALGLAALRRRRTRA